MKVTQRALATRRKNRQPQPRPAPGDLAIVLAFLNTRSPRVGDALSSPSQLSAWLAARGLLASDIKLKQRHLKRALAVLGGETGLAAGSDKFADALGRLLGMVAVARFEGSWFQLKACADRECGAAFFDARRLGSSRPGSSIAWCEVWISGLLRYRAWDVRAVGGFESRLEARDETGDGGNRGGAEEEQNRGAPQNNALETDPHSRIH